MMNPSASRSNTVVTKTTIRSTIPSSWKVTHTFAPHHRCWEKAAASASAKVVECCDDEKRHHNPSTTVTPSSSSSGPRLPLPLAYRSDLDMTTQLMDVKSHLLDRHEEWAQKMHEQNFTRPKSPQQEMHFLKLMVVEAIGRQKHFNSSALSARVSGEAAAKQEREELEEQKQQQQQFQPGPFEPEQVREKKKAEVESKRRRSQMYVEKAFDLDFVGKTLLADVETVYTRFGYKTTLDGLKNLRLWDLS